MTKHALLIATTNTGKSREFRALLKDLSFEISTLSDLEPAPPFEEKGNTFLENARGKSLFHKDRWKDYVLGEDSGLEIDYLKGAPGVYSARFAGDKSDDEKNIQKVLALLKDTPQDQRQARFVSCVVLSKGAKVLKEITESVQGIITRDKKGSGGFGYDPIFYYPPLNKTFAQLKPELKNQVSHRGKALKKLKEYLLENINK